MSEWNWQDCYLCDIIEAQLLLFFHLSGALDRADILPREISAEALRRTAEQDELRPGVKSCLCAIAELLERPNPKQEQAGPAWQPKVVPGEAPASGKANGAGNGHAANDSLPAGWQPHVVGDDDPDPA
jgi:hypothetical protein